MIEPTIFRPELVASSTGSATRAARDSTSELRLVVVRDRLDRSDRRAATASAPVLSRTVLLSSATLCVSFSSSELLLTLALLGVAAALLVGAEVGDEGAELVEGSTLLFALVLLTLEASALVLGGLGEVVGFGKPMGGPFLPVSYTHLTLPTTPYV